MKTRGRAGQEDTDALLASIGAHLREEQKDDAQFERIARGEATPAELAEVKRAADADADVAVRLQAAQPLSPEVVSRIADRAVASLRKAEKPSKEGGKVVSISWARRAAMAAGPLALAAGLLLYVATGSRLGGGPELPAYSVNASSQQEMRGPTDSATTLRVGHGKEGRFELVLRPATAPVGKVVAYPFAIGASGSEPTALDAKIEVAPEGAVRISGGSRALEGAREVRVVVGAPDAIGKYDDALARAKSSSADRHVQVITVPVERD